MPRHDCILTASGLDAILAALEKLPGRFGKDERRVQKGTIAELERRCDISYVWARKILNQQPGVTENRVREVFKTLVGHEPIYGDHYTGGDDQPEISIEGIEALNAFYSVRSADKTDIVWLAALQTKYFSKYAASAKVIREWFAANPSGFFVIEQNRQPIGSLTVLPFREDQMRQFCRGEISAPKIGRDGIYSPDEYDQISELYAENIIVDSTCNIVIGRAVEVAVKSNLEMVQRVCNTEKLSRIYCMPVTLAGLSIARKLGFELSVLAKDRPAIRADLYIADYRTFEKRILRYRQFIANK